jgi:hypothetical protein
MRERYRQAKVRVEATERAGAELRRELGRVGVSIDSIRDLRRAPVRDKAAIILVANAMQEATDEGLRSVLVDALHSPQARRVAGPVLVAEFRRASTAAAPYRYQVADAIGYHASAETYDEILRLAADLYSVGAGIERPIGLVEAIGKMRQEPWRQSAVNLLQAWIPESSEWALVQIARAARNLRAAELLDALEAASDGVTGRPAARAYRTALDRLRALVQSGSPPQSG